MTVLVTGAAGFIGSAFLRLALDRLPQARIVVLDALTYAGNLSTIEQELTDERVSFHRALIQDPAAVEEVFGQEQPTHVVNFAAESHNDRSMLLAGSFIQSNTFGVYVLLEAARKFGVERFVHVSTDEVYGTIDQGHFTEESPLEPNTPYSASKAGGDLQVRAHVKAYKTPAIVTRGGNTYGPYQFPEKLIPFFVTRLIDGKKVPVYGEGTQVREWIHVEDHAAGVMHALMHGQCGEVYNVGAPNERQNGEVVKILLEETGRDESYVRTIPDPRHGAHDKRYSMSTDKLASLGWQARQPFEEGLRRTVRWYIDNEAWWRPLISTDDFKAFVAKFYGPSLGEDL
jgi:dTDP-glucose 4,6-dehydratase